MGVGRIVYLEGLARRASLSSRWERLATTPNVVGGYLSAAPKMGTLALRAPKVAKSAGSRVYCVF